MTWADGDDLSPSNLNNQHLSSATIDDATISVASITICTVTGLLTAQEVLRFPLVKAWPILAQPPVTLPQKTISGCPLKSGGGFVVKTAPSFTTALRLTSDQSITALGVVPLSLTQLDGLT